MPTWAYWALFFAICVLAIPMSKRLDDRERRRGSSSAPPPDPNQT